MRVNKLSLNLNPSVKERLDKEFYLSSPNNNINSNNKIENNYNNSVNRLGQGKNHSKNISLQSNQLNNKQETKYISTKRSLNMNDPYINYDKNNSNKSNLRNYDELKEYEDYRASRNDFNNFNTNNKSSLPSHLSHISHVSNNSIDMAKTNKPSNTVNFKNELLNNNNNISNNNNNYNSNSNASMQSNYSFSNNLSNKSNNKRVLVTKSSLSNINSNNRHDYANDRSKEMETKATSNVYEPLNKKNYVSNYIGKQNSTSNNNNNSNIRNSYNYNNHESLLSSNTINHKNQNRNQNQPIVYHKFNNISSQNVNSNKYDYKGVYDQNKTYNNFTKDAFYNINLTLDSINNNTNENNNNNNEQYSTNQPYSNNISNNIKNYNNSKVNDYKTVIANKTNQIQQTHQTHQTNKSINTCRTLKTNKSSNTILSNHSRRNVSYINNHEYLNNNNINNNTTNRFATPSKSKSKSKSHSKSQSKSQTKNIIGAKDHLKNKLNSDILSFFDKHRKSALLIGTNKYEGKKAGYYLKHYLKGGELDDTDPIFLEQQLKKIFHIQSKSKDKRNNNVINDYLDNNKYSQEYSQENHSNVNNDMNYDYYRSYNQRNNNNTSNNTTSNANIQAQRDLYRINYIKNALQKQQATNASNNSNQVKQINNRNIYNNLEAEEDQDMSNAYSEDNNNNNHDVNDNKNKNKNNKEYLISKFSERINRLNLNKNDIKNQNIIIFEQNIKQIHPNNNYQTLISGKDNNKGYIDDNNIFHYNDNDINLKQSNNFNDSTAATFNIKKNRNRNSFNKSHLKGKSSSMEFNNSKNTNIANNNTLIDPIRINNFKLNDISMANETYSPYTYREIISSFSNNNIYNNNDLNKKLNKNSSLPDMTSNNNHKNNSINNNNTSYSKINISNSLSKSFNHQSDLKQNVLNRFTAQSPRDNELIYRKAIEKILEKSHKNIDLTPIPVKKYTKNKVEKKNYFDAERTAVLLRKIEYSENLKSWKSDLIQEYSGNLFSELMFEATIIRIQRWWRKMLNYLFRKNPKIRKIQAVFRGYLYRLFCLDRIRALIRFSQLDLYFKIRNAKICLGILAVNFAKLFKENFLKENINKIISLFRLFRIRKKRLMRGFVNSLLSCFMRITVYPCFVRIRSYDCMRNAADLIKKNMKEYLIKKKLADIVRKVYFTDKSNTNSYYNPLIEVFISNRKKGFSVYLEKKRFLLGYVISKLKAFLLRIKAKKLANVLFLSILHYNKINKLLIMNRLFYYSKKKNQLNTRTEKIKSILYVYFKTRFYLYFIKYRNNVFKKNLLINAAKSMNKNIKKLYVFKPVIERLYNNKICHILTRVLKKVVDVSLAKQAFHLINNHSIFIQQRLNKLFAVVTSKRNRHLGFYLKKWLRNTYLLHNFYNYYNKLQSSINILQGVFDNNKTANTISSFNTLKKLYSIIAGINRLDNFTKTIKAKIIETLFDYVADKQGFIQNKNSLLIKLLNKVKLIKKSLLKRFFNKYKIAVIINNKNTNTLKLKTRILTELLKTALLVNYNTLGKQFFNRIKESYFNFLKIKNFSLVLYKTIATNVLEKKKSCFKRLNSDLLISSFSLKMKSIILKHYVIKKHTDSFFFLKRMFWMFKKHSLELFCYHSKQEMLCNLVNKMSLNCQNKEFFFLSSCLLKWRKEVLRKNVFAKVSIINKQVIKYFSLKRKSLLRVFAHKLNKSFLVNSITRIFSDTSNKNSALSIIKRKVNSNVIAKKKILFYYLKFNQQFSRLNDMMQGNSISRINYFFNQINLKKAYFLKQLISLQCLFRRKIAYLRLRHHKLKNESIIEIIMKNEAKLELLKQKYFRLWRARSHILKLDLYSKKITKSFKSLVKSSLKNKKNETLKKLHLRFSLFNKNKLEIFFINWKNKVTKIKAISNIIKIQKTTRMFLFYNKAKERTMQLVHQNWLEYLEQMKSIKKQLKLVICVLKKFSCEGFFNKLRKHVSQEKRLRAVKKLKQILIFKLRILMHKSFLNYKALRNIANERVALFVNRELESPSFKNRLSRQLLKNCLLNKIQFDDFFFISKMNEFFERKKMIKFLDSVILVQKIFRGESARNVLVKKFNAISKLRNIVLGSNEVNNVYSISTINNLQSNYESKLRIKKSILNKQMKSIKNNNNNNNNNEAIITKYTDISNQLNISNSYINSNVINKTSSEIRLLTTVLKKSFKIKTIIKILHKTTTQFSFFILQLKRITDKRISNCLKQNLKKLSKLIFLIKQNRLRLVFTQIQQYLYKKNLYENKLKQKEFIMNNSKKLLLYKLIMSKSYENKILLQKKFLKLANVSYKIKNNTSCFFDKLVYYKRKAFIGKLRDIFFNIRREMNSNDKNYSSISKK